MPDRNTLLRWAVIGQIHESLRRMNFSDEETCKRQFADIHTLTMYVAELLSQPLQRCNIRKSAFPHSMEARAREITNLTIYSRRPLLEFCLMIASLAALEEP